MILRKPLFYFIISYFYQLSLLVLALSLPSSRHSCTWTWCRWSPQQDAHTAHTLRLSGWIAEMTHSLPRCQSCTFQLGMMFPHCLKALVTDFCLGAPEDSLLTLCTFLKWHHNSKDSRLSSFSNMVLITLEQSPESDWDVQSSNLAEEHRIRSRSCKHLTSNLKSVLRESRTNSVVFQLALILWKKKNALPKGRIHWRAPSMIWIYLDLKILECIQCTNLAAQTHV